MSKPGELKDPNYKPILPAPTNWKLSHLPNSSAISSLPEIAGVPERPVGIKPKLSEFELAKKLLAQIEQAEKLDCRGALCTMFKKTDKVRKEFIKGFIKSISNPERPIGRQNLRLGTYCSKPENLVYGFKKLVEEGVNITVKIGGKTLHKIYFNDLQGPGTGEVFKELINKQCGIVHGLEEFYKPYTTK